MLTDVLLRYSFISHQTILKRNRLSQIYQKKSIRFHFWEFFLPRTSTLKNNYYLTNFKFYQKVK